MREAEAAKEERKAEQDAGGKATADLSREKQSAAAQVESDVTSQDKHPGKDMDTLFFQKPAFSVPGEDGTIYMATRPDKPDMVYRVTSDGSMMTLTWKKGASKSSKY